MQSELVHDCSLPGCSHLSLSIEVMYIRRRYERRETHMQLTRKAASLQGRYLDESHGANDAEDAKRAEDLDDARIDGGGSVGRAAVAAVENGLVEHHVDNSDDQHAEVEKIPLATEIVHPQTSQLK